MDELKNITLNKYHMLSNDEHDFNLNNFPLMHALKISIDENSKISCDIASGLKYLSFIFELNKELFENPSYMKLDENDIYEIRELIEKITFMPNKYTYESFEGAKKGIMRLKNSLVINQVTENLEYGLLSAKVKLNIFNKVLIESFQEKNVKVLVPTIGFPEIDSFIVLKSIVSDSIAEKFLNSGADEFNRINEKLNGFLYMLESSSDFPELKLAQDIMDNHLKCIIEKDIKIQELMSKFYTIENKLEKTSIIKEVIENIMFVTKQIKGNPNKLNFLNNFVREQELLLSLENKPKVKEKLKI